MRMRREAPACTCHGRGRHSQTGSWRPPRTPATSDGRLRDLGLRRKAALPPSAPAMESAVPAAGEKARISGPMTPTAKPRAGPTMSVYSWIAIGSALGGAARFALSGLVARSIGETFPWGTLVINVTGSFAIGFFNTLTGPDGRWFVSSQGRMFFMTGICGGYTTFSSFSLQTLNLAREGEWLHVGGNVAGSVGLCLLAVWLGHLAAASINSLKGS